MELDCPVVEAVPTSSALREVAASLLVQRFGTSRAGAPEHYGIGPERATIVTVLPLATPWPAEGD